MDGFIARTRDRKQVEKAWTMKTDNLSDNRPKAIEIRRKRGNRKRKKRGPRPSDWDKPRDPGKAAKIHEPVEKGSARVKKSTKVVEANVESGREICRHKEKQGLNP